jgi:hypothetical protein
MGNLEHPLRPPSTTNHEPTFSRKNFSSATKKPESHPHPSQSQDIHQTLENFTKNIGNMSIPFVHFSTKNENSQWYLKISFDLVSEEEK